MRSNSAIEAHNSSLHGEENTEYATGSGEISLSTDGIEGFSVEIPIARITLPHVAIQGHLPEWSSPVLLGTPEVEAGVGIQGAHPGSLTALLEAGNHETSVRHMQPGMLWAAASGVERSNQDNSQTHQLPVVTDQSLALGSEFAEGNSKPALLQSSTGILQPSEIHTGGKGESTVGRTSASLRGAGEPATPAMQSPGSEQGAAVRSATSQTVATTAARATPVAVVRRRATQRCDSYLPAAIKGRGLFACGTGQRAIAPDSTGIRSRSGSPHHSAAIAESSRRHCATARRCRGYAVGTRSCPRPWRIGTTAGWNPPHASGSTITGNNSHGSVHGRRSCNSPDPGRE